MVLLYNVLLFLLAPVWVTWMLWRTSKRQEKPDWNQRMGAYNHVPKKVKGTQRVWIQAVSVGEVIAALPVLRELRKRSPKTEIILSVTTSTGHATAQERAKGLYDHLVYFPIDVPRFALYAMIKVRPDVLAMMETEFWFNVLFNAREFQAKILLLNGRISDRSFGRIAYVKPFYRSLVKFFDRSLVQTETDADRMRSLGAKNVEVFGNTKFDEAGAEEPAVIAKLQGELPLDGRPVAVVGSTRSADEEWLTVQALAEVAKSVPIQVIHAPRHLESADGLIDQAAKAFGADKVGRRSGASSDAPLDYIVLDTFGELSSAYRLGTVAIIGGGFSKLGGQNLIQALAAGLPVLHGKYMHNFRDVTDLADKVGAAFRVELPSGDVSKRSAEDVRVLASEVLRLMNDESALAKAGAAGRKLVAENQGAGARYAQAIVDALAGS